MYKYIHHPSAHSIQAPSSHRTMSVADRVQNALCGIALLDVFRMLSDRECAKRGLPKGALFLAPETSRNLQHVAMGVITVALTPEQEGDPWANGSHRLTELPVEQHFGRLRVQSTSAQLTARSYWAASARDMLRTKHRKRADTPPPDKPVQPLSPDEFYYESEKALRSALKLAAFCQGCNVESLEEAFQQYCQNGDYKAIPVWKVRYFIFLGFCRFCLAAPFLIPYHCILLLYTMLLVNGIG